MNLRTRLWLLNAIVIIVFTTIIWITSTALNSTRDLSSKIATQSINQLIDNNNLIQELLLTSSKIELLSKTFYNNDLLLLNESDEINSALLRIDGNINRPTLKKEFDNFINEYYKFIVLCKTINAELTTLQRIYSDIETDFKNLEDIISSMLIDYTLNDRDTAYIDQLLGLTTGYKESLLLIGKLMVEQEGDWRRNTNPETPPMIQQEIDSLYLRLQTITASSKEVSIYGLKISDNLTLYRVAVSELLKSQHQIQAILDLLNENKKQLLLSLNQLYMEMLDISDKVETDIADITYSTTTKVIFISIIVVLFISLLILWFVRYHIDIPMKKIINAMVGYSHGEVDARINLNRNDEWRVIEKTFNDMTKKLNVTYLELENSETQIHAIFDNVPYFAWMKNVEGIYLIVNKPMAIFHNQKPSDIVGKSDFNVWSKDIATRNKKDDLSIFQTKQNLNKEETIELNGKRIWLETYKSPLYDVDGKIIGIIGFSRDITERKKMELALLESNHNLQKEKKRANELANKAEIASIAKSTFLANMSHEIRTPLNGILGVCQIFSDTPLNEEQKKLVETMNVSGQSLLGIISDILDYSKIESGKIQLENTSFNLFEIIENAIELLTPSALTKKLKIENLCIEKRWPLYGDSVRLTQVIMNLMGNAIKFTESGKVSIDAAINRQTEDEMNFTVSVKDTGIGIEKSKVLLIFDDFTQADLSTTRKFGGTGLGLTISRKIIELMGGELQVTSEINRGSIFSFSLTLPKKITINESRRNNDISTAKINDTANILLVEDDRVNQMVARKLLEKLNCQVTVANNGQEAIDSLNHGSYNIIFMDIQMPIMDGIEATRHIRKKDKNSIIIAMTANVMKEDKQECLDAGMNDFISKPIKKDTLSLVISKWASSHEAS